MFLYFAKHCLDILKPDFDLKQHIPQFVRNGYTALLLARTLLAHCFVYDSNSYVTEERMLAIMNLAYPDISIDYDYFKALLVNNSDGNVKFTKAIKTSKLPSRFKGIREIDHLLSKNVTIEDVQPHNI
jgi:hypothetical protein